MHSSAASASHVDEQTRHAPAGCEWRGAHLIDIKRNVTVMSLDFTGSRIDPNWEMAGVREGAERERASRRMQQIALEQTRRREPPGPEMPRHLRSCLPPVTTADPEYAAYRNSVLLCVPWRSCLPAPCSIPSLLCPCQRCMALSFDKIMQIEFKHFTPEQYSHIRWLGNAKCVPKTPPLSDYFAAYPQELQAERKRQRLQRMELNAERKRRRMQRALQQRADEFAAEEEKRRRAPSSDVSSCDKSGDPYILFDLDSSSTSSKDSTCSSSYLRAADSFVSLVSKE